MSAIEIIVLVLAVLLVSWTIALAIYRKKKGKNGCCESHSSKSCGGCASCPYGGSCAKAKAKTDCCATTEQQTKDTANKV